MIQEQIRNYIIDELFVDKNIEWDDNTDIMSTGLLDSLSMVRLLVFIEDTFDISLNDVLNLDNFRAVNVIGKIVESKIADK